MAPRIHLRFLRLLSRAPVPGRTCVMVSLSAVALAAGILAACVIADPPPELPRSPLHRPTIVHGSVFPPTTTILTAFPAEFDIPVELVDPTVPFEFNMFVDFDPVLRANPLRSGRVDPGVNNTDGGIVLVSFSIVDNLPDPSSCHVIEFIVANSFNPASIHTPDSVGGDSVVWFLNPSGDLRGCPTADAGIDGAFPEDATPDRLFIPETGGGG